MRLGNIEDAQDGRDSTELRHSVATVRGAGGVWGRSLFQLEQPFEIAALDIGTERVAEPFADRFQDLAGALDVDLVGDFHRIAEIGTLAGARPAERVAVGILLTPAFLAAALV